MTIRMIKKILLDFKCDNNMFLKYRSIHYASNTFSPNIRKSVISNNKVLVAYFSNKRSFSSIQNTSSEQQIHTKFLKGSLLCNNNAILKRVPNNPIVTNNIRQYSNSLPTAINDAVKYNGSFFQFISESAPVEWATEAIRLMHYQADLPFWASIVLTTVIVRTFVHLPLSILDHRSIAKRLNLGGEMNEIAKRVKMEIDMGIATSQISPKHARSLFKYTLAKEQKELIQRENCHPFKSVAIMLLQLPIWLSLSVAVRNMCYMLPQTNAVTLQDYNELAHGGFGWIQNLISADPTFTLALLIVSSSLASIEIHQVLFKAKTTKFGKIYTNFMRLLILCLIPIMGYVPSALGVFWLSNSLCAMSQNLLLLSPKFRRLTGIPKTELELQHPYAELYKRVLGKIQLRRSIA